MSPLTLTHTRSQRLNVYRLYSCHEQRHPPNATSPTFFASFPPVREGETHTRGRVSVSHVTRRHNNEQTPLTIPRPGRRSACRKLDAMFDQLVGRVASGDVGGRDAARSGSTTPTCTPTNSLDIISPGLTRPAHCMNMALTADVRSGAASVRKLCEPDARLIHPDHNHTCARRSLPARLRERHSVPERAPHHPSVACP